MFKETSKELVDFLMKNGVDPLILFTFFVILIHFLHDIRFYKKWNEITLGRKFRTIMASIVVLMMIFLSLMRAFGVLKY